MASKVIRHLVSPLGAFALFGLLLPGPARACAMALVLGLDVSASVSAGEYRAQQDGLADALTHSDVTNAIVDLGGLWITAFEWSGTKHQYSQLGWSFVDDEAGIAAVAGALRQTPRLAKDFATSVGHALDHALALTAELPEPCARTVIDLSSDGEANEGITPQEVYARHDMRRVTVNALVISKETRDLPRYYLDEVVFGPSGFVQEALRYEHYAEAMRRKLLREIGARSFAMMMP